jgi:hypothetical protein
MKTLGTCVVVVFVVAVGSRSALPNNSPKERLAGAKSCGRGSPQQFCAGKGLGTQEIYLEGQGLEGHHFSLTEPGSGPVFPPKKGMLLTDSANCDSPVMKIRIGICESGTTAMSCQVEVVQGPEICGEICGTKSKALRGVVILRGYWDETGTWQSDANVITLSCNAEGSPKESQLPSADGAIDRCLRDYRFEPTDKNENLTACIRMQRADYCGDGTSHTYIGTNIDVRTDKITPEECQDGSCFEASWSDRGAICVGHTRWTEPNLDFDKTPCRSQFKPAENGLVFCRGKQSHDALFTRSKINTCGIEAPNCKRDASPGCALAASKRTP